MKKQIFLLASVLMAGCFASCSNGGDYGIQSTETEPTALVIQLPEELLGKPEGRAIEDPKGQGKTAIDDITVFMMIGENVYESHKHTLSNFTDGYYRYEQVPGNINNVIVVVNAVGEIIDNLTTAAAIRNYAYTVASQHKKSGLDGRTLMGEEIPVTVSDPDPDGHKYKLAAVKLNALTSRIEVGTVKAGEGIEKVELLGVWINYYYPIYAKSSEIQNQANTISPNASPELVWGVTNSDPTQSPAVPSATPIGTITVNTAAYTEANYVERGSSEVQLVDGSKVYAFHTFSGNVPHLILLIKGEYAENHYEDNKKYFYGWVTYTRFKTSTGYANPFEPNKIYKMGVGSKGIVITEKDIYPEPEINPFDLGLKIEVVDWIPEEVTPEI